MRVRLWVMALVLGMATATFANAQVQSGPASPAESGTRRVARFPVRPSPSRAAARASVRDHGRWSVSFPHVPPGTYK